MGCQTFVNWRNPLPKQMVPRRLLHMFFVKFKNKAMAAHSKVMSSRLQLWVAQWLRDVHPLGANPFGAARSQEEFEAKTSRPRDLPP